MPEKPQDLYGTYGSVPSPGAFNPAGSQETVRASPDDFGAQIGAAQQKLGATGEKIGSDLSELALKQQGMINETLATNAESSLIMQNAKLKGEFLSTEGMETVSALPGYMNQIHANDQQIRSHLPAGALRMYDMLAQRQKANYMSEAQSYASGQLKRANMNAGVSLVDLSQAAPLDPDVAHNPARIGQALGDAQTGIQMQLDDEAPGFVKDENGNLSFDENTQEGQLAKASYDSMLGQAHGAIWENAIKTISNTDPLKASQVFQENQASIPPAAQVRITAALNPKIENAYAQGEQDYLMSQVKHEHQAYLTNPSSAGSNAFNLGNVKTPQGAAAGTADFVSPATPVDGAVLAANTLRSGYQGMTLAQIGAKWTGEPADKVSDWVKNASAGSGLAPDAVPDLNNPAALGSLLKGIALAEKSPVDRSNFTDDVIAQGVQASLTGAQPATVTKDNALPGQIPENYGKNANGAPVSLADYVASHRQEIFAKWDAYAEQKFPGNPTFRNAVRERVSQQMNQIIQDQAVQYKQDNAYIMKGIAGQLSDGKAPMTWDQLYGLPGMKEVLDRAPTQDIKFYESIPTMMARTQRKEAVSNSPNGFETIMRVLEPNDPVQYPNRIASQDHLGTLLGKTDGNGINGRDYEDAKKGIEYSDEWKKTLSSYMRAIQYANGNVDGQGQQRAIDFYNTVGRIRENMLKSGTDIESLNAGPDKDGKGGMAQTIADIAMQYQPARITQIANAAKAASPPPAKPQPPEVGAVVDGYQFQGGDPADKNNWKVPE